VADLAVVLGRDVVTVEGPEAEAYLQGQLSQDVTTIEVGSSAWTFALQPQGKVDAWFRLSRLADDRFLADIDEGHGEALQARLQRFLLRTDCRLSVAPIRMVAVRGTTEVPVPDGVVVADPAWPGQPGVDLLGEGAMIPDGLHEGSAADYERLRIEAGVPAMGSELTERTIPTEAGVVERSVSFTKGCFTGQELVARIDSRGGNVPRHLRGLEIEAEQAPAPGTPVQVDGRPVGEITSSAPPVDDRPAVALAYVGRAVVPPASALVGDAPARIIALPA
jgi:tRNA-modifying protein YgfZ